MSASAISSRITESAVGLAKDLFSTSANGHAGYETTNDLAALRSAHKLSSVSSNSTSSSPRLPKALSSRHRGTAGFVPNPRYPLGPSYSDSAFEDELSGFLQHGYDFEHASPSSSRSGSTLDLTLENGIGTDKWHREDSQRNDGVEPEAFESEESLTAFSLNVDGKKPYVEQGGHLSPEPPYGVNSEEKSGFAKFDFESFLQLEDSHSCAKNGQEDYTALETLWNNHRTPFPTDLEEAEAAKKLSETEQRQQKEKALGRLRLISSHMAAMSNAERLDAKRGMALNTISEFETSFSQLCHGDESQEWAEFEERLLHHELQSSGQRHAQPQQNGQVTATGGPQQRAPAHANLQHNGLMQQMDHVTLHDQHQSQAPNKKQEQKKDKEPMPTFHCPWVECHRRFRACTDYIRDTEKLGSLSCVHANCELEFGDEDAWREHISTAHHGLLPRLQDVVEESDMENAWEKAQA